MMESIAAVATEMSTARMAVEYSMALMDKTMEQQETVAQGLVQMMLPPVPQKGDFIDTYA